MRLDGVDLNFYLFPGDKTSVYADLTTPKTIKGTVRFSGTNSTINQSFFNVQYRSALNDLHWNINDKAEPQIMAAKIEQFYNSKHLLLKQANKDQSANVKAILALDSIKDDYVKAASLISLAQRNHFHNDSAWNFVNTNIPPRILTFPTKALLDIPAVRNFWSHQYLSFLISRDAEKEPDFYLTKGYYLSALKKIDTAFHQPLQDYAKASLLFNLLQDPSSFRLGQDSLWNLTRFFATNCALAEASKKALLTEVDSSITRSWSLTKGDLAPNFSGQMLDGSKFKLSDLKGKDVLIDVWASWCKPCIAQLPYLKKHEEYPLNKKVVCIMVSIDEDEEKWRSAAKQYAPNTIHVLANEGFRGQFGKAYNINSIPRYILIRNLKIENWNLVFPAEPSFLTVLEKNLQ